MATEHKSVGFIGLGTMGFPMCENLIKKLPTDTGFFVYDVSQPSMDKLCASHGARVTACTSSKQVAENAEVIISMVPEGSHVRSVYLDPSTGAIEASLANKLLIDCSTIDTATSSLVKSTLQARHPSASFYDAPVSGGSLGAQAGTLTFMLGCDEGDAQLGALRSVLGLMGSSVLACGGAGLGLTAKLCNNYCSGLIALATAEAMNAGMRAGMDPRTLQRVFAASLAQSTVCDRWCPVPGVCPDAPSSRGYRGGFKVQLMRKDFGLAVDMAERVGARLVLGELGLETYTAAMEDPRCRDRDSRVVFRYIGGDEDWDGKMAEREA